MICAQTDPSLSRTVVVSTKLDTRIPQFARGQDVELFLHPPGRLLEPGMLGGCPFYTCAAAARAPRIQASSPETKMLRALAPFSCPRTAAGLQHYPQ